MPFWISFSHSGEPHRAEEKKRKNLSCKLNKIKLGHICTSTKTGLHCRSTRTFIYQNHNYSRRKILLRRRLSIHLIIWFQISQEEIIYINVAHCVYVEHLQKLDVTFFVCNRLRNYGCNATYHQGTTSSNN